VDILTRRGLKHIGLDFRAEVPSVRALEHLFWINEVRVAFEDEYEEMDWTSEREILAEQELRQKGQKLKHILDGILELPSANGELQYIDIKVQISKTSPGEVEEVMCGDIFTANCHALRYYVNRLSRRVVQIA